MCEWEEKMNAEYALGKLSGATHILTTHPEGIKVRLLEAYEVYLISVSRSDIPVGLRPRWNDIMKRMSKFGAAISARDESRRDAVEITIPRIHKKTASKIAEDIEAFGLYLKGAIQRMEADPVAGINSVTSLRSSTP